MSLPKSFEDRRTFWQSHVDACAQSGLSKIRYCREHQLHYHQLIYWYSKLSTDKPSVAVARKATQSGFVPVGIELEQPAVPSSLQVRLPNGVVIEGITERSIPLIGAIVRQL